ncbi:hypothetical protein PKF032_12920 [Polynucleobacter yangtzensis]|uniref:Uncharacterized protein n=1 Tax=Polynucleobacter yangtzensis TaxID=1743159 RepID=A0ABN6TSD3_9BURK|nr:hypothetical protein PKF032_12920 [Polynucleobacter yangtzensis]
MEDISCFTGDDQTLLDGDRLQLAKIKSPATLYARVKNLSAIRHVIDKEDGHRKFVIPTKMACKYNDLYLLRIRQRLK